MKRFIIPIVIFLIPIILTLSFIRISANKDPFISSEVFVEYLGAFPKETIDSLKDEIGAINTIGFANKNFNPDWSGNVFEDIAAVGKLIADVFTALFDYLIWSFRIIFFIVKFLFDLILWVLNFPKYIVNY